MKTLKAYIYLKTTRLLPKTLIGSFARRQEKQLHHVRRDKAARIHEQLHHNFLHLLNEKPKVPLYNIAMDYSINQKVKLEYRTVFMIVGPNSEEVWGYFYF